MRNEGPSASAGDWRTPLTTTVLIAALVCLAHPLNWLDGLEARLIDLRFAARGARAPAGPVVIVAMGDSAVQRYPDLPMDPGLHAKLVRRLDAAGAAAIGLDIPELARPGLDDVETRPAQARPYHDLTAAISESGRVVLPLVLVPGEQSVEAETPAPIRRFAVGRGKLTKPLELRHPRMLHPRADLCASAAGLGVLNVYPDRDWTVRKAPLLLDADGHLYPSFALAMARVAGHGKLEVSGSGGTTSVSLGSARMPTNDAGEILIDFAGPTDTYPMFAYEDILEGEALAPETAGSLRGKLVLVGATAVSLPSRLRTPFSPYMTGVELNANVLDTLLSGRLLARPTRRAGVILTLIGALLAFGAGSVFRPWRGFIAVGLLLVGLLGASSVAFAAGVCLPTAGPLLAILLVGTILSARRATTQYVETRRASDQLESRMSALAREGRLLNSGLNRDQLLTEIMVWVEEEIECEAASLVLLREEDQKLRFEVALGPKGDEIKDVEIDVGHGIVGVVVETGEPLAVPNTDVDPRFAREIASAVGFPAHSILCVPMSIGGRVVGAIEVINKRAGTSFTENDTALLTIIAQHAAMFLETARLYGVLEERVDLANQELRLTNQQLSTEKAKLEAIVDHMADGIVAADERGRIVLINKVAADMLGVTDEDLFGAPAVEALPNPELAELFAAGVDVEQGGRELTLGDPVQRIIRARPALAVDEQGVAGRVVVMSDITDLRELDRTKTDMVSFVSHELKNPLAAIRGFAGLIRDRSEEAAQRGHAEVISRQAERMYRLIDDFLNIARIDIGRELEMRWEQLDDVRSTIEEAVEAESSRGPRHRFTVIVPEDLPPFCADPDKLYQVFVNLINNAVKYSPDGGEVRIAAAPEDEGKSVRFIVRDEGIGIHPDNMRHLFKRFRRVTDGSGERVEGTGLGLFLTRHLIQAHGGRIWAESRPGKGSTFHFVLPIEGKTDDERNPQDRRGRSGPT